MAQVCHALQGAGAALIIVLAGLAAPADAATREGVSFPVQIEHHGVSLSLAGVGVLRWHSLLKVYVGALYLGAAVPPSAALSDVPKRIEIEYFYAIPAHDFAVATERTIAKNAESELLERLQPSIARLDALYENIEPGDRYALTYQPGIGTELEKNGRALGVVEGAEFARALFGIWIGPNPLDGDLRSELLGAR